VNKIGCWRDLDGIKNGKGLSLVVREFNKNTNFFNCYVVDDKETCILLGIYKKCNMANMNKQVYKFGFEIEYKKSFDLVQYLKESIEPKEFNFNERNFYFAITEYNGIEMVSDDGLKVLNCQYFHNKINEVDSIGETLKNEKITIEQLNVALKELGWI